MKKTRQIRLYGFLKHLYMYLYSELTKTLRMNAKHVKWSLIGLEIQTKLIYQMKTRISLIYRESWRYNESNRIERERTNEKATSYVLGYQPRTK